MHDLKISVRTVLGDDVAEGDVGKIVFNIVYNALRKKKRALLSFEGVDIICLNFLNAAIGQLYGVFPEEHIRKHLSVDISLDDVGLIKHVVETAKKHFRSRSDSRL
jgi:hypothetical protein